MSQTYTRVPSSNISNVASMPLKKDAPGEVPHLIWKKKLKWTKSMGSLVATAVKYYEGSSTMLLVRQYKTNFNYSVECWKTLLLKFLMLNMLDTRNDGSESIHTAKFPVDFIVRRMILCNPVLKESKWYHGGNH